MKKRVFYIFNVIIGRFSLCLPVVHICAGWYHHWSLRLHFQTSNQKSVLKLNKKESLPTDPIFFFFMLRQSNIFLLLPDTYWCLICPPYLARSNDTPPNRPVPPTPPPSPTTPTDGATNNSILELENMVRQVQEVLPHIAKEIIRQDLSE